MKTTNHPSNFRQIFICLLLFLIGTPATILGQTEVTVSGTVYDEANTPLPGVNVVIQDKPVGTTTDFDGNYSLEVESSDTLIFSYIGFLTQRIPVSGQTLINATLVTDVNQLDDVVVIGYSTQSRAKVTNAISSVNDAELANIPSVSPTQALQGKMAGVSVPVASGQPGANPNVVIRGGTTLSPYATVETGGGRDGSDPLYIVDGVFRDIGDINPNDIESIQVLKDAASTAIYGARGANGVIVVKTKTGKSGKSTITVNVQTGVETQARTFDYLNARQYIETFRPVKTRGIDNYDPEVFLQSAGSTGVPTFNTPGEYGRFKFTTASLDNLVNVEGQAYVDDLLQRGWETMPDPVDPARTLIFKDSNYQDVVWNTAHTNNYNLRFTGGGEKFDYNVSLGYVDQGGVFLGTDYSRFSALANLGFQVTDKLRLSLSTSYLWNDSNFSESVQNDITRGTRIPDLIRLYNDDGTPNLGESLNPRNRLHQLFYQDYQQNLAQYVFRLGAEYQITPSLVYRPSVSLNTDIFTQQDFERFFPEQRRPRDKYQRIDKDQQVMTDQVLQYNTTIGENHNIMALVGFNYTKNQGFRVIGTSQRAPTDIISTITGDPISTTLPGGIISPNQTAESLFAQEISASYFGQVNYDFKSKYLLGASLRQDGFSNFAPNNRYALFPSLSAGYIVSNENFWNVDWVNFFKIRSSWGKTGLSNLDLSDTFGSYAASTSYATNAGINRTNLANPNLLWETTTAFDVGFDVNFFNNRLNVVVDYYNKLTDNRLADLPLPAETGFQDIKFNVGSLRNSGMEIELGAMIIDGSDFSWRSNFSFAYNEQVVVDLPENTRDRNRIDGGEIFDVASGEYIEVGGFAEGERPGGLWAWKANGVFATDEEAAASPNVDLIHIAALRDQPKHGGDTDWADLDGNNEIDERDMVFMGYRTPDKIGGLQNTFRYKNFSLRVNMDYALGHVISNGSLARAMGQARSFNEGAPAEAIGPDVWSAQGDTGKKYPRISFGDWDAGRRNHLRLVQFLAGYRGVGHSSAYATDNSIYYSKGDFLAFREVSLSYRFPTDLCEKMNLSSIVLNGGVFNIGYLTAYDGYNPEVYTGYDGGAYPRPRQYTLSATISF